MDVLSSQSNLAEYRAVVDCVAEFENIPMMTTLAAFSLSFELSETRAAVQLS